MKIEQTIDEGVLSYAKEILENSGCDVYTYGGEQAKYIMDDLKQGFPDGMKYPYIDVANAILSISRPALITREPYRVYWDNDSCSDGYGCSSLERAKDSALETLIDWEIEETARWGKDGPDDKQKEDWDYMIYNCYVSVYRYNPNTDEYEFEWEPSNEELLSIGWGEWEEIKETVSRVWK